jgi:PE-PPE domain/PE family
MGQIVATPELLESTAANVERIRSEISAAHANAAGPTTGLLAAAEDEVSEAVANLFGDYGRQYQALLTRATEFHSQFSQALAGAGSAYSQAESTALRTLGLSLPTLGGSTGGVATSFAVTPLVGQQVALIMGGTFNPLPDLNYVLGVSNSYIQPHFPGFNPQAFFTPEQFAPVTPQLGPLTFGTSVAQGVSLLHNEINSLIGGGNPGGNKVTVFGYSQSATVATNEINYLMSHPGIVNPNDLSFTLVGDPNNPNGGILERFTGFYIPLLNVDFNGATNPNSPFATNIYTIQYDGIADAPQHPLNVLSDVNALLGYFYVHSDYPTLTPGQVAGATHLATSPGYTGNTNYYMMTTQNLPLIRFIHDIPYAGPPLADIIQPDLRVLVDMGYGDIGPGYGYANIPTPASLFTIPNFPVIAADLARGAVQGPYAAVIDIGIEAGAWGPDLLPDAYPYVPSLDPHLHISLGQPSTTGFSRLTTGLGDILRLIPPLPGT